MFTSTWTAWYRRTVPLMDICCLSVFDGIIKMYKDQPESVVQFAWNSLEKLESMRRCAKRHVHGFLGWLLLSFVWGCSYIGSYGAPSHWSVSICYHWQGDITWVFSYWDLPRQDSLTSINFCRTWRGCQYCWFYIDWGSCGFCECHREDQPKKSSKCYKILTDQLVDVLLIFGCWKMPTPSALRGMIIQAAR